MRRFLFAATLGMVLTGVVVYAVAPSPSGPPVPPVSAPPVVDASPEPDGRAFDDEEFARLVEEVERLRAKLDAGSPDAAEADLDASDAPDAADALAAVGSSRPKTPPARPAAPCVPGFTPAQFAAMSEAVPALRQLPPKKLRLMMRGSPECSCSPGPSGDSTCKAWCPPRGAATGRCVPGFDKCECSN